MTVAADLGPRVVVVQCPRLPTDAEPERGVRLRETLTALGGHGDRIGVALGLEIGFDPAEGVRDYLATFPAGSLAATLDPANFLTHGHDPLKQVVPLAGRIVLVHARDARGGTVSSAAQEVRLGGGDVDWLTFTATLAATDYRGFLMIERESGEDKLADVTAGVAFLKRVMIPT